MKFRRLLLVLAITGSCSTPMWAQEQPDSSTVGSADTSVTSEHEKAARPKQMAAPQNAAPSSEATYDNSLGRPLLRNLMLDEKAIWTSPSRLRLRDASWLVPLGGFAAALFVTDSAASRHLSNSPNRLDTSRKLSDFGTASLVGAAGGLYLWGSAAQDEHKRETGLLSGEALIDSLAFGQAIKFSTGRERPRADNARGSFGQGGSSFPSDHAIAVWSVASVVAHEYPGPLTKLLAYGLASAVSTARVTSKEHFPSDVLVGSAIGWLVGQQVYRAHHNPELGGGTWETPSEMIDGEARRHPGNMGSPYVPLDSWVYPVLERLAALGYVHTDFLGLRPWTRSECARLLQEADEQGDIGSSASDEVTRLFHALTNEFGAEGETASGTKGKLRIESVYTRTTEIVGKPLVDSYHFGQTIINDFGRPYQQGFNSVTGFSSWASAGPFVVYMRGEYQHAPSAPAYSDTVRAVIAQADLNPVQPAKPIITTNAFRLLDSYVAMNVSDWQMSFGKQSLWWGLGQGGALLLSTNAEPIYMFRASRVTPFMLPWVFHWLGPMKVDAFFGTLSGNEFPRKPAIHGEKISFKPTRNLELGFTRLAEFGGVGRPLTPAAIWNSYFSTRESNFYGPNENPGKRTAGFDVAYRVPFARNWLTVYTDSLSADDVSPISAPRRAAINPGLYLTHLPKVPQLDIRVEAVNTETPSSFPSSSKAGRFVYYDHFYHDLSTSKNNVIGSWIGREGQGIQVWSTYWLSPQNTLQFGYRHGKVSADFIPDGGTLNDFRVGADFWLRHDLSVSSYVQYELWKFPVLAAGAQSNVTSSFQLTFWPRWLKN